MIKINDSLLRKTVEHIQYEIDMFRVSAQVLGKSPNRLMMNAFLEIFAIHFRNLVYFFYTEKNKRRNDDVIVFDYIKDIGKFKKNRAPKRKVSIALKKTAKQVAHLAYYRTRYNDRTKPWRFYDLSLNLENKISARHL